MENIRKLTWLSYFLFIILGVFYITQGVLIIKIAPSYNISLAYLGYLLFIPAVMQAVTTFANGYLLDRVNLKIEILIGLSCIVLSVLCTVSGIFPLLIAGLFPLGIGYGLLCSIPNYLIITLHPEDKFSKLNILNFFFSIGGISGPFIVGQLLEVQINWKIVMMISFVLFLFLYWFTCRIPFSSINNKRSIEIGNSNEEKLVKTQKWNLSIYLIGVAMLAYVLSEICFSSWLVAYLKMDYNYSIFKASIGLAVFWGFITFGRFAADKIGRFMKIYQFIIASSALAFISYLLFFFSKHTGFIFSMIALMGLGYASLYASVFSYGMDQVEKSSPKLMSFFIICGSIGNILAMPLSSFFVEKFSVFVSLCFGLFIMGLVVVLIVITVYDKNNIALENRKRRRWGAITRRTRVVMVRRVKYLRNLIQV